MHNPDRRRLLLTAAGAAGLALLPAAGLASMAPALPARRLRLANIHTGERIDIVYFEQGRYLSDALTEIDFLLRDFRANQAAPIERGVIDLVHAVTQRLDSNAVVEIISGYRSPDTNALLRRTGGGGVAKRSLHMDGRAIDLRIPGRDLAKVRKAALSLQGGGVGYYPGQQFVHIDNGRVRQWAG